MSPDFAEHLFACTCVELHDLDGNGDAATPAVLSVRAPAGAGAPIVVIVGGPFAHPAARAQAGRIARRQTGDALRVAVFDIDDEAAPPEAAHLDELHAGFHAVVVVTRGQREQVLSRLVRTILKLDGQDQWIGCDWHDVSHIVRASRGAAVRFGCGHGAGSERAALATREAIRQADRQGPGLRAARGICIGIRASSRTIHAREIKEAIQQIRARIPASAMITMSLSADSTLEDSAFEVDLFAFGLLEDAELARQAAGADDVVLDPAGRPEGARQAGKVFRDPLYGAARSLVMQHQRASISLVQRHLRIGYGRASRLLDSMEGAILSAPGEDGIRTVLVPDHTPQRPVAPPD